MVLVAIVGEVGAQYEEFMFLDIQGVWVGGQSMAVFRYVTHLTRTGTQNPPKNASNVGSDASDKSRDVGSTTANLGGKIVTPVGGLVPTTWSGKTPLMSEAPLPLTGG